jgi:hypothetical protein
MMSVCSCSNSFLKAREATDPAQMIKVVQLQLDISDLRFRAHPAEGQAQPFGPGARAQSCAASRRSRDTTGGCVLRHVNRQVASTQYPT